MFKKLSTSVVALIGLLLVTAVIVAGEGGFMTESAFTSKSEGERFIRKNLDLPELAVVEPKVERVKMEELVESKNQQVEFSGTIIVTCRNKITNKVTKESHPFEGALWKGDILLRDIVINTGNFCTEENTGCFGNCQNGSGTKVLTEEENGGYNEVQSGKWENGKLTNGWKHICMDEFCKASDMRKQKYSYNIVRKEKI